MSDNCQTIKLISTDNSISIDWACLTRTYDIKSNVPVFSPIVSVFGRTGIIAPLAGDYTVSQITGAAPLDSPIFIGIPTAPTPSPGTNNNQIATTQFVNTALDTLENMTLNASAITSGTLSDARLSSNVALRNANNTFTQNQVFSQDIQVVQKLYFGSGSSPDVSISRESTSTISFTDSASAYINVKLRALTATNDVEVTTSSNGLILRSPNGTRWRITIGDDGIITSTSI
jgi:hypothetical protein